MGVIVGLGVVAAVFYGLVNAQYLSAILSETLGPVTDTLADVAFRTPEPETWRQIAIRHGVTIMVEPAHGDPVAFDAEGRQISEIPPTPGPGEVGAVRTGHDGTKITFYYAPLSFREDHFPRLAGLLVLIVAVVGSAFWFLQRQLKPLTALHAGVDAVARGDFEARVPVVRDDEIGQVAEAFNVMADRVGEMIDDRERLLADVSHELRSPIARMKVALEFVPEGDKRDALAKDLREMENLIAILLEREELRSRTGRLEGEAVDLNVTVGEVATAFADRAPGVEIAIDGAVTIHADPALMKLLLQNLLDNGIKFSHADSRPVVVSVQAEHERVILRVADDGIGIPAGNEERLFEPFAKLDRARGHRVGYGIGLNLCQRIVQLHGGTIRLVPREPRGTEAIVSLPRPSRAG